MKKSIQIITTAIAILCTNIASSQVDSVYIVKGDSIMAVYATTDLDSVVFYRPNVSSENTNNTILTDIDGNVYTSVTIGTQEWMAENLRTSKYTDGTVIPNVTDSALWGNLTTGAWSHNNNDSQYDSTFGKLYNWYAVETGKLCPTGWHVPTHSEWTTLTDYLSTNGYSGEEGTALKANYGWNGSGNGSNDYGWNGLAGGGRVDNGHFHNIGISNDLWSSSEYSEGRAWYRYLVYSDAYVHVVHSDNKSGLSVRCLKD